MADVGQDVAEHARARRGADRLGRAHVVARRVLDELGAYLAVDAGPADQRQDDGDAADAAAEDHRKREQQEDVGNRREDVVDPLQQVADLAAEKARDRAEQGADDGRDDGGEQADEDRGLRSLHRLGENVAAEPVRAERQGQRVRRE